MSPGACSACTGLTWSGPSNTATSCTPCSVNAASCNNQNGNAVTWYVELNFFRKKVLTLTLWQSFYSAILDTFKRLLGYAQPLELDTGRHRTTHSLLPTNAQTLDRQSVILVLESLLLVLRDTLEALVGPAPLVGKELSQPTGILKLPARRAIATLLHVRQLMERQLHGE